MLNLNASTSEIIALLLPDPGAEPAMAGHTSQPATAIVRDADGRMSLATVAPETGFGRQALGTGCFRKGKPIIDPVSREIMGYEMERVDAP